MKDRKFLESTASLYNFGNTACQFLMRVFLSCVFFAVLLSPVGCTSGQSRGGSMEQQGNRAKATFGGGCFWCVEAVFEEVDGVLLVASGYSGGDAKTANYRGVSSGVTRHAEVVQVTYNPQKIAYKDLLEIFWKTHDPTMLNRQGNDVGTQYRSVVFYHDEAQHTDALTYKKKLEEARIFARSIVTEIVPFVSFHEAEDYHQDYYRNNPTNAYCQAVILPKLEKFRTIFADKLKH